jgi:hypothetical protein
MQKWFVVAALALQAHFAVSYLVPLDERSQREFGGLLRWFWPWAYGNGGPLGQITQTDGFPTSRFFLAVTAGGLLMLAALAVAGLWVPASWSRPLIGQWPGSLSNRGRPVSGAAGTRIRRTRVRPCGSPTRRAGRANGFSDHCSIRTIGRAPVAGGTASATVDG